MLGRGPSSMPAPMMAIAKFFPLMRRSGLVSISASQTRGALQCGKSCKHQTWQSDGHRRCRAYSNPAGPRAPIALSARRKAGRMGWPWAAHCGHPLSFAETLQSCRLIAGRGVLGPHSSIRLNCFHHEQRSVHAGDLDAAAGRTVRPADPPHRIIDSHGAAAVGDRRLDGEHPSN